MVVNKQSVCPWRLQDILSCPPARGLSGFHNAEVNLLSRCKTILSGKPSNLKLFTKNEKAISAGALVLLHVTKCPCFFVSLSTYLEILCSPFSVFDKPTIKSITRNSSVFWYPKQQQLIQFLLIWVLETITSQTDPPSSYDAGSVTNVSSPILRMF